MTRTYYDEERDGEAIKILDFVEFVNTFDSTALQKLADSTVTNLNYTNIVNLL